MSVTQSGCEEEGGTGTIDFVAEVLANPSAAVTYVKGNIKMRNTKTEEVFEISIPETVTPWNKKLTVTAGNYYITTEGILAKCADDLNNSWVHSGESLSTYSLTMTKGGYQKLILSVETPCV